MIKNVLAAVASMGLAIAPMAAQAGTRASGSGVSMSMLARSGARVGNAESDVRAVEILGTTPIIIGGVLVGVLVVFLMSDGSQTTSPVFS